MRGHGGSWTITYNVLFERPSSRSHLKNVDWLAFFVSQVFNMANLCANQDSSQT